MKTIIIVLASMVLPFVLSAQGVFSNQTNVTLEKVIQDYPNQFKTIRGDLVLTNAGSKEYKSSLIIPGAISSSVFQYNEAGKHPVSWETVLYASEDFDDARQKFKNLYDQIKNTIVKLEGERPVILNGKYEAPEEDKSTNTILFDILPATTTTQHIKIDLALQKINRHWNIVLSVYDRDHKEDAPMVANSNR